MLLMAFAKSHFCCIMVLFPASYNVQQLSVQRILQGRLNHNYLHGGEVLATSQSTSLPAFTMY